MHVWRVYERVTCTLLDVVIIYKGASCAYSDGRDYARNERPSMMWEHMVFRPNGEAVARVVRIVT